MEVRPANPSCGMGTQPPCGMTTSDNGFSGNAGYVAPAFNFDGGMLIGSTPGAKFFLGLHAVVDFAPTITVGPDTESAAPSSEFQAPGRGYVALKGPQVYFGPTLGMQFGH